MTPWGISERDLDLIRYTMAGAFTHGRRFECLEWGSGGTTIKFPDMMVKEGIDFHWTSIEHNEGWYHRVMEFHPPAQVELVRCEGDPHRDPMYDYVNLPLTLGKRFDFVFVDGRKRRRCLITASKLLAPGGVVVLHDAEREWYHPAFEHFSRHERIGDKLWRGWVDL